MKAFVPNARRVIGVRRTPALSWMTYTTTTKRHVNAAKNAPMNAQWTSDMNHRHPNADPNDVVPTATQLRAARAKARHDAFAAVETALASLDDARRHLAFISADEWLEDCKIALSSVEDLRDSMEVDDG